MMRTSALFLIGLGMALIASLFLAAASSVPSGSCVKELSASAPAIWVFVSI